MITEELKRFAEEACDAFLAMEHRRERFDAVYHAAYVYVRRQPGRSADTAYAAACFARAAAWQRKQKPRRAGATKGKARRREPADASVTGWQLAVPGGPDEEREKRTIEKQSAHISRLEDALRELVHDCEDDLRNQWLVSTPKMQARLATWKQLIGTGQ